MATPRDDNRDQSRPPDLHPPTVTAGGDEKRDGSDRTIGPMPPPSFGDFRLIREVGRGGMGVVYEAWQNSLNRRVALKVLSHGLGDARHRRQFEREARAAGQLHHTNIVPVYGVGDHLGIPYYFMQFIRGVGLDALLDETRLELMQASPGDAPGRPAPLLDATTETGGEEAVPAVVRPFGEAHGQYSETIHDQIIRDAARSLRKANDDKPSAPSPEPNRKSPYIPPDRRPHPFQVGPWRGNRDGHWKWIADLGMQAAAGLAYAHSQNIQHRDVKPSNLLLDDRGTVWVTDFGLAKWSDHNDPTQSDVVGTLRYMSPEAFAGGSGSSADIYGLGLTLYELLARRPAFDERDRARLILQVTEADPPPLWNVNRAIPLDLAKVVHKAIEKDPKDRYASASDLQADLQRFLNDLPVLARRLSPLELYWRWAKRNPAVAILGSALSVVLLVATAASLVSAGWFREQAVIQRRLTAESESSRNQLRLTLYDTQANLAWSAWTGGDYGRYRELLDQMRPDPDESDLRGWEWHYLERLDGEAIQTVRTPDEPLICVTVHPDGERFATLSLNGVIRVWREDDGSPSLTIAARPDQRPADLRQGIHGIAYSPDGTKLIGPAPDGDAGIYDAESGELLLRIECRDAAGLSFRWSPDGARLAGAFANHLIRFWRSDTGEELTVARINSGHEAPVAEIEWSRDGRHVVTAGLDGAVILWRVGDQIEPIQVLTGHEGEVRSVAFSADGQTVASAGLDGTIRLWDVTAGVERSVIQAHEGGVLCLEVSDTGGWAASGGNDDAVRIWDLETGRPMRRFLGHTGGVRFLSSSPDGDKLVSVATDGIARVWDPYSPIKPRTFHDPSILRYGGGASCVAVSPDGRLAASGHDDQVVRIWDVAAGVMLHQLRGTDRHLRAVAFSPDSRLLAACVGDSSAETPDALGSVTIWDLETATPIRRYAGHRQTVNAALFLGDGAWLATGGGDHEIHIWNAETGDVRAILKDHESDVRCLAFIPKRGTLASGSGDGSVRIWSVDSGRIVQTIPAEGEVWALAAAPDGASLAVAQSGAPLLVWDLGEATPVATLIGHEQEVSSLVYTPDGRLVSGGRDKTIRVWDLATERSILTLKGHTEGVRGLAISPNGGFLASASRDRTVRIWETTLPD